MAQVKTFPVNVGVTVTKQTTHQRTYMDDQTSPYGCYKTTFQPDHHVCKVCGKEFNYLASLLQHEITDHSAGHKDRSDKTSQQAISRFQATEELSPGERIKSEQLQETRPRHPCETCGKQFSLVENLNRHQMIHSDVRPFKCPHCGKSFRLSQHLKEHIRIHTGEKPYKCGVCGHAFCQISNLKSHQKTHSKEKAFRCDVCDKTFRRAFTLKQHKVTHSKPNAQQAPLEARCVDLGRGSAYGQEAKVPSEEEVSTFSSSSSIASEIAPQHPASDGNDAHPSICLEAAEHSKLLTSGASHFSPILEAFLRSCQRRDPERRGSSEENWPEISALARLARPDAVAQESGERVNESIYNALSGASGDREACQASKAAAKRRKETAFFVDQIIGTAEARDKEFEERRTFSGMSLKRFKHAESPSRPTASGQNTPQRKHARSSTDSLSLISPLSITSSSPMSSRGDASFTKVDDAVGYGEHSSVYDGQAVLQHHHDLFATHSRLAGAPMWPNVVPLIEWKPVLTGWRNLADGTVYAAYQGYA